jgi:hypothetical protein
MYIICLLYYVYSHHVESASKRTQSSESAGTVANEDGV